MKTVWHLNSNRWNSAVTEYSLSSAMSLKLQGWTSIYSGLNGKSGDRRAKEYGLETHGFDSFGVKGIAQFLRLKSQIKPDLIIVYGGPESTLCLLSGSTPVLRFRGQDRDATDPVKPFSYRIGQSHINGVICPSQSLKTNSTHGRQRLSCLWGVIIQKFHYDNEIYQERPVLTILGASGPCQRTRQLLPLVFSLYFRLGRVICQSLFFKLLENPQTLPLTKFKVLQLM